MKKNLFKLIMFAMIILSFSCDKESHLSEKTPTVEELPEVSLDDVIAQLQEEIENNPTYDEESYQAQLEELEAIKANLNGDEFKEELEAFIEEGGGNPADLTAQNFSASYKIRTWKIKYPTKSVTGENIFASGTVSLGYVPIPFFTDFYPKLDYVLLHNHVTIGDNAECPTEDDNTLTENGIVRLLALNDSVVVSPDYEGYGETRNRTHPYLNNDVISRQSVDMLKAALDFIENSVEGYRGKENDCKLYNVGYSQGGGVALAVHKLLDTEEKDFADDMNFRGTFAGAGPYNPYATFEWYLSNYDPEKNDGIADGLEQKISFPILFPLVLDSYLLSYKDSYLEDYKIEDYLHENMFKKVSINKEGMPKVDNKSVLECVRSKNYTAGEITKIVNHVINLQSTQAEKQIEDILTPAALDPNSDCSKALTLALKKNDLTDGSWVPTTKIRFYHSKADEVVPWINYKKAEEAFEPEMISLNEQDGGAEKTEHGRHAGLGKWFFALNVYSKAEFKDIYDYH